MTAPLHQRAGDQAQGVAEQAKLRSSASFMAPRADVDTVTVEAPAAAMGPDDDSRASRAGGLLARR